MRWHSIRCCGRFTGSLLLETLKKHGWRCGRSRGARRLEIHHRRYRSHGGSYQSDNLEPSSLDDPQAGTIEVTGQGRLWNAGHAGESSSWYRNPYGGEIELTNTAPQFKPAPNAAKVTGPVLRTPPLRRGDEHRRRRCVAVTVQVADEFPFCDAKCFCYTRG
jgi:hypothetical protein